MCAAKYESGREVEEGGGVREEMAHSTELKRNSIVSEQCVPFRWNGCYLDTRETEKLCLHCSPTLMVTNNARLKKFLLLFLNSLFLSLFSKIQRRSKVIEFSTSEHLIAQILYSRRREKEKEREKVSFFTSSAIIERQTEMESSGVKPSIDRGLPREELTNVFFFIDHVSTLLAFEFDISARRYFHSCQISRLLMRY